MTHSTDFSSSLITQSDPRLLEEATVNVLRPWIARKILDRRPAIADRIDLYKAMFRISDAQLVEDLMPVVDAIADVLEGVGENDGRKQ